MTPSEFSSLIAELRAAIANGTADADRMTWLGRLGEALGTAMLPMDRGETYHIADMISAFLCGAVLLRGSINSISISSPSPLEAIVHPVNVTLLANLLGLANFFYTDHVARALWRTADDDLEIRHLAVMYKTIDLWQHDVRVAVMGRLIRATEDVPSAQETRTIN